MKSTQHPDLCHAASHLTRIVRRRQPRRNFRCDVRGDKRVSLTRPTKLYQTLTVRKFGAVYRETRHRADTLIRTLRRYRRSRVRACRCIRYPVDCRFPVSRISVEERELSLIGIRSALMRAIFGSRHRVASGTVITRGLQSV